MSDVRPLRTKTESGACPPCNAKKCPRTDAIVLIVVGAVLLVIGATLVAAHYGMEAMADKLLFNAPPPTYGPTDPRLHSIEGEAIFLEIGNPQAKRIAVFLHGTASDAGTIAESFAKNPPHGDWKVWIPEYPGFGVWRNSDDARVSKPSERGSIAHAKNVMEHAAIQDPNYIVMAHSLGTGVAMGVLASESDTAVQAPSKLVLVSPFTSFKAVVASAAPFWATLVPERFPSLRRASAVASHVGPTNITVFHGEKDQLVPIDQGKQMASAMAGSRFEALDAGHDSMNVSQLLQTVLRAP